MMRKMFALAALVAAGVSVASPSPALLSTPAAAASVPMKVDVTRVPVPLFSQFRGEGSAIVTFTNQAEIDKVCGTFPNSRTVACVDDIGGKVMTLPNPCDEEFQGEDYAAVVCHEKGHTLGWRHEMPAYTHSKELP